MTSRAPLILLALAAAALAGCGSPRVRIEWSRPPRCPLPTERKLALKVESDGPRPSASEALDTVLDVTHGQVLNKWVAVKTVEEELGVALQRAGYALVDPAEANAIVRVRPTAWAFKLSLPSLLSGKGRLDIRLEVIDGRSPTATARFRESYYARSGAEDAGEPEAMLRASRALAGVFLADTRPSRVSAEVELDDEDPACEAGIALCKRNQFEAAHEAFTDAVARKPGSGPALYDLAVMKEIRGEYAEAEGLLQRATKAAQKPLYYSALERIRAARKDAEGLR